MRSRYQKGLVTAVPSGAQCRMNEREHNRRTAWLAQ